MRRTALYSRSSRAQPQPAEGANAVPGAAPADEPQPPRTRRLPAWMRNPWLPWALLLGLCIASMAAMWTLSERIPRALTQDDIDTAVRQTLEHKPLPSQSAKAYEAIRPSVVRVVGYMDDDGLPPEDRRDKPLPKKGSAKGSAKAPGDNGAKNDNTPAEPKVQRGVGTGVVVIDKGVILTNLHVVMGARQVKVIFDNGLESDASVVSVQPENDLAVLQAQKVPDDLVAATLRSTGDLTPGDEVIAVGHPFGIGPSVSAGVVSGLRREFRSDEGQRVLTNLIQFDAAANPGNSGGPLVTMDGAVVGIVTAILNPSQQRVFIGIGFAVPIENAAAAAGMPPF